MRRGRVRRLHGLAGRHCRALVPGARPARPRHDHHHCRGLAGRRPEPPAYGESEERQDQDAEGRYDAREHLGLEADEGLPKIVDTPPKMQKAHGKGTMLIARPRDVDALQPAFKRLYGAPVGCLRNWQAADRPGCEARPLQGSRARPGASNGRGSACRGGRPVRAPRRSAVRRRIGADERLREVAAFGRDVVYEIEPPGM